MRPPHGFATVTVRLVNGTADGRDVAGDSVKLTVYAQGRPVAMLESFADDEGKAVFNDVVTGRGIAAAAQARHGDMAFGGHVFNLEPGKENFETVVDVFEVSTDNSKLSVGLHHFILRAQANTLIITEVMQLINPTDTAISSALKDDNGKPKVLHVYLPPDYRRLEVEEHFQPEALVLTPEGFYDTMALPPGKFEAVFSYVLPITSPTVEVSKTMSMPVADFKVFSQLPPGSIEGLGSPAGRIPDADAEYFAPVACDPGQTLTFKVVGFNAEYSDAKDIVILSAVFAIIIALGARRLIRPPQAP